MSNLLYEDLSYKIRGAARAVYKELGHGYLESVYEDALCYELDLLRARSKITSHFDAPIHPAWLRCSLVK